MDQGWIKLHRQIGDNMFLMQDEKAFNVFIKLLICVNKKGDISGGRRQLGTLFNINDRTLYDVFKRLENQQMININSNHQYSVISICNWSKYQQTPTAQPTTAQPQPNRKPTASQHSNKNKKENKNINTTNVVLAKPEYGNSEINSLFDYWQELTGNKITAQAQKNRYACKNLITKHGEDILKRMIGGVAYSQGEQFAPRIANFIQLQAKWDELVVWGKQHKSSKAKGGFYQV